MLSKVARVVIYLIAIYIVLGNLDPITIVTSPL